MSSAGLTDPLAWTPEAQGRGRKTRSNGQMDNTQAASRSKMQPATGGETGTKTRTKSRPRRPPAGGL